MPLTRPILCFLAFLVSQVFAVPLSKTTARIVTAHGPLASYLGRVGVAPNAGSLRHTTWTIEVHKHNYYVIRPFDTPLFVLQASGPRSSLSVELAIPKEDTEGFKWDVSQVSSKGFRLESHEYTGFFLANTRTGLLITNDTRIASNFTFESVELPKLPFMMACSMSAFEEYPVLYSRGVLTKSQVLIPGLDIFSNTNNEGEYVFFRETVYSRGHYYNIQENGTPLKIIFIRKNEVIVEKREMETELEIANATWIIRTIGMDDQEVFTLLFESKAQPGMFLGKEDGVVKLLDGFQPENLRKLYFNATIPTASVSYFISADMSPRLLSIASTSNTSEYLGCFNGESKLTTVTDEIESYGATWKVSQWEKFVTIECLTSPGHFLTDHENNTVSITERKVLWRITYMGGDVMIESRNRQGWFLSINSGVLLTEDVPFMWNLSNGLAHSTPKPMFPVNLDLIMGKTIKLTAVRDSNITFHLANTASSEKPNPSVYRFIVKESLAGVVGHVSLQSMRFPDHFVIHDGLSLTLAKFKNTNQFKTDATWKFYHAFQGSDGGLSVSIEPYGYPGLFVTYSDLKVKAVTKENMEDASFLVQHIQELNHKSPGALRRQRRYTSEL